MHTHKDSTPDARDKNHSNSKAPCDNGTDVEHDTQDTHCHLSVAQTHEVATVSIIHLKWRRGCGDDDDLGCGGHALWDRDDLAMCPRCGVDDSRFGAHLGAGKVEKVTVGGLQHGPNLVALALSVRYVT